MISKKIYDTFEECFNAENNICYALNYFIGLSFI